MTSTPNHDLRAERGSSLIEMMVALTVLAIGVLAVAQLFPAGSRSQVRDRLRTEASQLAREKIEQLEVADWTDADLAPGRHPAGGPEKLGSVGALARYYDVSPMSAPLDNLRQVTVHVTWNQVRACTVQAVTYVRR
jgi:prepilin-type N-terminal cleavage/methylation domain-containing protein